MRRPAGPILVNAVLIAGAALTLTPILWMISASTMPIVHPKRWSKFLESRYSGPV